MKNVRTEPLLTPEGEQLREEDPWAVYPRPLLERDSFFCLTGMWSFCAGPEAPEERIRVPYPPESVLSGIGRSMGAHPHLIYRRRFSLPEGFRRDLVFLHFGAVDQVAEVFLNGVRVGSHAGGYEPFSFDISEYLQPENLLEVCVRDALSDGVYPYGKQRERRGGMWYTPISGIWQTVWLESVCRSYIRAVHAVYSEEGVEISVEGPTDGTVSLIAPDGQHTGALHGGHAFFAWSAPRLWSPSDPYLYRYTVQAGEDHVASYFAVRHLTVERQGEVARLCLNGTPFFFHAVLDQGYYSDGLYTPASPVCYEKDICAMKALGFNTLRKHIKVEPALFYYACDRLGMIVFQDMVNNGRYSFWRDTLLPTLGLRHRKDRRMHRDPATRAAFCAAMDATADRLRGHPSVCLYTIFNEGWGQFDSPACYRRLKSADPTRWIDTASGWFAGGESDVESLHVYFRAVRLRPPRPQARKHFPLPRILSEFGGYSCALPGHVFRPGKSYGYRQYKSTEALEDGICSLYRDQILPAIRRGGLCAAVYTQLSDVEDETNGLLTYDRRVCKVDVGRMRALATALQSALEESGTCNRQNAAEQKDPAENLREREIGQR